MLDNDLQAASETENWACVKVAKCKAHKAPRQVSLLSANSRHATVQLGVSKPRPSFIWTIRLRDTDFSSVSNQPISVSFKIMKQICLMDYIC